jgi:hypothetical protein
VNLSAALRECAVDLLETEERVDINHLVDCAEVRYPEAFAEETERLIRNAAARIAKGILTDLTADDTDPAQGRLPGLDLPSAIAVPGEVEGGYYYVRTDKARYEELLLGRHVRDSNVKHAQKKLDAYDESLDVLRPYMEGTSRTVAEAIKLMESVR